MLIDQKFFRAQDNLTNKCISNGFKGEDANLVLIFGAKKLLSEGWIYNKMNSFYPNADIVTCSTAGEIVGVSVDDDTIVSTAITFKKTKVDSQMLNIRDFGSSFELGIELYKKVSTDDLSHILIISDGQLVNGTELINGVNANLDDHVSVTGGLAADAANFTETLVGLNEDIGSGNVVAVGFYGDQIKVNYGTQGGWDEFGPFRKVTKSKGNVLYEIDNQNALELYKKYLGPKADELPGSALLFPLSMKKTQESQPLVRTILSVDEDKKTMTFAGDIEEGATVRFMKANFDRLVDGAAQAAYQSQEEENSGKPELVLLISCVGRKLVLDQRIEEEVEAVEEILGMNSFYCGFYSYGELSPSIKGGKCDLHNQTMTLTTYSEN